MATRKKNCGCGCGCGCDNRKPKPPKRPTTTTRRRNGEHTPPRAVRRAAEEALELLRERQKRSPDWQVSAGFPQAAAFNVLWGRALSSSQLVQLYQYAITLNAKKQRVGWSKGERGYPARGLIEFMLLGGLLGIAWARKALGENVKQGRNDTGPSVQG